MHIGGVLLFDGPAPPFADVLDHVRGRLHLLPRYRQKLAIPPAGSGRPLWIDDPNFNIEYHVRHAALPAPGSESQLLEMAARIASRALDRTKPLWEFWLVEGIEPGAGSDARALRDDLQEPPRPGRRRRRHRSRRPCCSTSARLRSRSTPASFDPWQPQPEPSAAQLLLASARDGAGAVTGMADARAGGGRPARPQRRHACATRSRASARSSGSC